MELPNIAAYAYQDVHVWSALLTCLRPHPRTLTSTDPPHEHRPTLPDLRAHSSRRAAGTMPRTAVPLMRGAWWSGTPWPCATSSHTPRAGSTFQTSRSGKWV